MDLFGFLILGLAVTSIIFADSLCKLRGIPALIRLKSRVEQKYSRDGVE